MKHATKIILLFIILAALAFPTSVFAKSPDEDKVIFGGTYTLASGDTLDGNLAVLGGSATIEKSAHVNGNVVLTGGSVEIDGEVNGNVSAMGGSIFLGDNAIIHGDVSTLGATLHRGETARIDGRVVTGTDGPFSFTVPTPFRLNLKPLADLVWFFFRTLAMAALAMLAVLFLAEPVNRTARAIVTQPVMAGGLGLLTAIIAPVLLVILAITIILIPVSLLGILLVVIAVTFGWIAIGTEVGRRIAVLLKQDWPLPISAGLGTFLLSLIVNGIGYIPCVGWIAPAVVAMLGLGGVILTRFGMQIYPTPIVYPPYAPPTPPVPPAPPAPPAPSYGPPTPPSGPVEPPAGSSAPPEEMS